MRPKSAGVTGWYRVNTLWIAGNFCDGVGGMDVRKAVVDVLKADTRSLDMEDPAKDIAHESGLVDCPRGGTIETFSTQVHKQHIHPNIAL